MMHDVQLPHLDRSADGSGFEHLAYRTQRGYNLEEEQVQIVQSFELRVKFVKSSLRPNRKTAEVSLVLAVVDCERNFPKSNIDGFLVLDYEIWALEVLQGPCINVQTVSLLSVWWRCYSDQGTTVAWSDHLAQFQLTPWRTTLSSDLLGFWAKPSFSLLTQRSGVLQ
jgi:hypothetical protein